MPSFVEYIANLANECGWQIRDEGEGVAYLDFTLDGREEVVDAAPLTDTQGNDYLNVSSAAEIPISAINDGKDGDVGRAAEWSFDQYFLARNMRIFHGAWGILKMRGEKHYVFNVRIRANELNAANFRLAVSSVLEERKELFNYVTGD